MNKLLERYLQLSLSLNLGLDETDFNSFSDDDYKRFKFNYTRLEYDKNRSEAEIEMEIYVRSVAKKKQFIHETEHELKNQKFMREQFVKIFGKKHRSELIRDKDFFKLLLDELDKCIVGERDSRHTILLTAGSIFVTNSDKTSSNLLVNDEGGAGKDHVTEHTLGLFKDKLLHRTRISPTAFTYWHNKAKEPEWSWNGKIFYGEDLSNDVLNCDVFKVMSSGGSVATIVVNQKAVDIEICGKPSMIITSASANPKQELLRRYPICTLDTSVDQTKAIMERKAELAEKGISNEIDEEIYESLKLLKQVKVKIPFATLLVENFPKSNHIVRTHFSRFLDYIKFSAALHQYQRERDVDNYLIAIGQDYDIARIALIKTTSNQYMIPLTKDQKMIIDILSKLERKPYTVEELESLIKKWAERQLRRHLDKLVSYNILERGQKHNDEGRRPTITYQLIEQMNISIPTWENMTNMTTKTKKTIETTMTNKEKKGLNDINDIVVIENDDQKQTLTDQNNEFGRKLLHDSDSILDGELVVDD